LYIVQKYVEVYKHRFDIP